MLSYMTGGESLRQFPNVKPLLFLNSQMQVVYANKVFVAILGTNAPDGADDIKSDPPLSSVINGLRKNNFSSFQFDLYISSPVQSEKTNFLADIERLYIGSDEYFVVMLSSLGDRIRIEDKINSLHNALEFGNIPVIITDNFGKVEYVTQSFEGLLQERIEDLYGKSIDNVLSDFLAGDENLSLKKALNEGAVFKKILSGYTDEKIWFKEINVTPVRKVNDPSVNFIVTANDITDYVQKNRVIRRSEEKQKSIINNISDLLLIVKKEGNNLIFENANDNFYELFSVSRQASGKPVMEVLETRLFSVLEKEIKENKPDQTFRLKSRYNGREYQGKLTFIDDPYEPARLFIVSLSDITDQLIYEEKLKRAIERESHISRLKSSFMANMSHEIRTPLNAIVGYSELISDDVAEAGLESVQECVGFMMDGVNRLLNVVENIFEMSLLESDELELDNKSWDCGALL